MDAPETVPSYPGIPAAFRTPRGNWIQMWCRDGTSDWNTVNACSVADEYHLPRGISGWALDVGAHIGGATVPLLVDNPNLRVVAIEALPDNVRILQQNLELNGVRDRAVVLGYAAGDGSQVPIGYSNGDTEFGRHHRFIGAVDPARLEFTLVDGITLHECYKWNHDQPFEWAKIDCEHCEYPFLEAASDIDRAGIRYLIGEHHGGLQRIRDALANTHHVRLAERDESFGTFVAVAK